jgi:hypothetical protein
VDRIEPAENIVQWPSLNEYGNEASSCTNGGKFVNWSSESVILKRRIWGYDIGNKDEEMDFRDSEITTPSSFLIGLKYYVL